MKPKTRKIIAVLLLLQMLPLVFVGVSMLVNTPDFPIKAALVIGYGIDMVIVIMVWSIKQVM